MSDHNVTVTLGAQLSGSFVSVFQTADTTVKGLRTNVLELDKSLKTLAQTSGFVASSMKAVGSAATVNVNATVKASTATNQATNANLALAKSNLKALQTYDALSKAKGRYSSIPIKLSTSPSTIVPTVIPSPVINQGHVGPNTSGLAGLAGIGMGYVAFRAAELFKKGLDISAEFESSQADLDATLMKAGGRSNPLLDEVIQKTIQLGNELPGTTKDFKDMMTVLGTRDITAAEMIGGIGDATAKLSVVLRRTPSEVADYTTAIKNALKVTDTEMVPLTDTIQRLHFTGARVDELSMAISRAAASGLLQANVVGLDETRKAAILMGTLLKSGMSGERTGTNFGKAVVETMNSKNVLKANQMAPGLGLRFTQAGKFLGVDNFMEQMDKIGRLPGLQKTKVLDALFGGGTDQGVAEMMARIGTKGFKELQKKLAEQASLDERINRIKKTFDVARQALVGTMENVVHSAFIPLRDALTPIIWKVNNLMMGLQIFLYKHKLVSAGIVGITGAVIALTAALAACVTWTALFTEGGLLYGFVTASRIVFTGFATRFILPIVGLLNTVLPGAMAYVASTWLGLVGIFEGAGSGLAGLWAIVVAFGESLMGLGAAVAAFTVEFWGPIALVILAVAAIGATIWSVFRPIKAWFTGFWDGLTEPLRPAWEEIKDAWGEASEFFGTVWDSMKDAAFEFLSIFGWSDSTLKKFELNGRSVGRMIGTELVAGFRSMAFWIRASVEDAKLLMDTLASMPGVSHMEWAKNWNAKRAVEWAKQDDVNKGLEAPHTNVEADRKKIKDLRWNLRWNSDDRKNIWSDDWGFDSIDVLKARDSYKSGVLGKDEIQMILNNNSLLPEDSRLKPFYVTQLRNILDEGGKVDAENTASYVRSHPTEDAIRQGLSDKEITADSLKLVLERNDRLPERTKISADSEDAIRRVLSLEAGTSRASGSAPVSRVMHSSPQININIPPEGRSMTHEDMANAAYEGQKRAIDEAAAEERSTYTNYPDYY